MLHQQSTYSFDFDFGDLALTLVIGFLLFIALTFPYRLVGTAKANGARSDGSLSRKRVSRELKKLGNLIGELALFPIIGSAVVVGVLMSVHTFIIPIPLVVDVTAMFSTDAAVWEERTETGELGDVGRIYGEWSDEQGYSAERAFGIRKFLKRNWFVIALLGLIGIVGFYWFFTSYYLSCLRDYKTKLIARKKQYAEHDGLT